MDAIEAKNKCISLNMEIVSIPNQEWQNDILKAISAFQVKNHVWTSGSDAGTPGVFRWNGKTLPTDSFAFTNWVEAHPVLKNETSYIAINKNNKFWYSQPVSYKFSALCVTDLDVYLFDKCEQRRYFLQKLADASNDEIKQ